MRSSELALMLLMDIVNRGDREIVVIVCDGNPLELEEGSKEVVCGATRLMKLERGEELVLLGWEELPDVGEIIRDSLKMEEELTPGE